ncbi:A disintegrin and metalloproteinase with thrombospondin motifs 3-like isoform X2 [Engraulis encrasicolus]|uniref:A disintegrin and metalloproteinase with thrombospondin motifs 3-like isoform X2 n=1 Tax=Engraulis encrasicolus TaxID=184585 RepID=UPI002FD13B99
MDLSPGFAILIMLPVFLQTSGLYISSSIDSLQHKLGDYGLVRPMLTDAEGRFLSHAVSVGQVSDRQFRRRWRREAGSYGDGGDDPQDDDPQTTREQQPQQHATSDSTSSNSSSTSSGTSNSHSTSHSSSSTLHERLYYNVTIFGREMHLRLRLNSRLVAPGAKMEWHSSAGEGGREEGRRGGGGGQPTGHTVYSEPLYTGCLYVGEVLGTHGAAVAISNCDGLAGMIRTEHEEFFIEPLEKGRHIIQREQEGGGREHIVYRTSALKKPHVSPRSAATAADDYRARGAALDGLMDLEAIYRGVEQHANQSRSRRQRRQAQGHQGDYNIEVMLGVDNSVQEFHGGEHVQMYLLTLMNIVNEIYHDDSLGARINVVLIRIVAINATTSARLIVTGNPASSLQNVCRWAWEQQKGSVDDKHHHDHAIFLTRQEFGPTGMQGYAPVTGMCHPVRSCTLNHEDGFSSAFVVAHETGHVLGMEHDGQGNRCGDDVPLGSIMAPLVQAAFHRFQWSRCSKHELNRYLHSYDCLRDDPFNHDWPPLPSLPGLHYSMNEQCRFDFGAGYMMCTAYRPFDPCKQLWCSHPDNPFFCKTKKGPPIDGTTCGDGMHCFKGHCMQLSIELTRQNGHWGAWSPWGQCTHTCGGGVRFRTRDCNNPPPVNGGRTCLGPTNQFELCQFERECQSYQDSREKQCQQHSRTKNHWLPYEHIDPKQRCQLHCQSKESRRVMLMANTVEDGTRCSYKDPYSMCVRGTCEKVGCDGVLGSAQQEDYCGVCGGDNSSCHTEKGNVNKVTRQGYLRVLHIPSGARHLLITIPNGAPHSLVVKNTVNRQFFLNADQKVQESISVIEKGVEWEYEKDKDKATLQATGPLRHDIEIMINTKGARNITLSYKYIVKRKESPPAANDNDLPQEEVEPYGWEMDGWSLCSKTCGQGMRHQRYTCTRTTDGARVEERYCVHIMRPSIETQYCNENDCPIPIWDVGEWEPCSETCGKLGYQTRLVACYRVQEDGTRRKIRNKYCNDNRPDSRQPCNRHPCPHWKVGPWSECSVTCGSGSQERQVQCRNRGAINGTCMEAHKPALVQKCFMSPCQKYKCYKDRSVFCKMEVLQQYCNMPGYQRLCCVSCAANITASAKPKPKTQLTKTTTPQTTTAHVKPTHTKSTTQRTTTAHVNPINTKTTTKRTTTVKPTHTITTTKRTTTIKPTKANTTTQKTTTVKPTKNKTTTQRTTTVKPTKAKTTTQRTTTVKPTKAKTTTQRTTTVKLTKAKTTTQRTTTVKPTKAKTTTQRTTTVKPTKTKTTTRRTTTVKPTKTKTTTRRTTTVKPTKTKTTTRRTTTARVKPTRTKSTTKRTTTVKPRKAKSTTQRTTTVRAKPTKAKSTTQRTTTVPVKPTRATWLQPTQSSRAASSFTTSQSDNAVTTLEQDSWGNYTTQSYTTPFTSVPEGPYTMSSNNDTSHNNNSFSNGTSQNSTMDYEGTDSTGTWFDYTPTEGPTDTMDDSMVTSTFSPPHNATLGITEDGEEDHIALTTSDWTGVTAHTAEMVSIPSTHSDHTEESFTLSDRTKADDFTLSDHTGDMSFMSTSPVPMTTSTAALMTSSPTVTSVSFTTKPARQPEVTSEGNAIKIPFRVNNDNGPVNNAISQRNRLFLRDRTRNKRIQQLLEERRNLLLRLKREQATA